MKQKIPWEDLKTPFYEACEVKKRKQWIIIAAWILTAMLLITGIMRRNPIGIFFAFLMFMSMISKKSVAVTERGLENFMDMRFTSHYELWRWSQIEALTYEKVRQFPGSIQIYFTKGDRTRKVFFQEKDWKEIHKLAKSKNSKIRVYDGNAYIDSFQKKKGKKA